MKGIPSHTIKLDKEMSYEDGKDIKDFTKGMKENQRLKIDIGKTASIKNGIVEQNITATFTKTNNNKLLNLIHKFEKLKNNILVNKSLFHKPELTENIFNHSSISVKKLNLLANEIKITRSDEYLKTQLVEANETIIDQNNPISTQKKLHQEEINKIFEDYDKYKEENKSKTLQYNTNLNINDTEVDKMWKIIKDDIGL